MITHKLLGSYLYSRQQTCHIYFRNYKFYEQTRISSPKEIMYQEPWLAEALREWHFLLCCFTEVASFGMIHSAPELLDLIHTNPLPFTPEAKDYQCFFTTQKPSNQPKVQHRLVSRGQTGQESHLLLQQLKGAKLPVIRRHNRQAVSKWIQDGGRVSDSHLQFSQDMSKIK